MITLALTVRKLLTIDLIVVGALGSLCPLLGNSSLISEEVQNDLKVNVSYYYQTILETFFQGIFFKEETFHSFEFLLVRILLQCCRFEK